ENIDIDDQLVLNDLTFSGTDNGIVTITEISHFRLDRFKFHLNLQNRYSLLSDSKEGHDVGSLDENTLQYLNIPKIFKIKSSTIHYKGGAQKLRDGLRRAKASHDDTIVQEVEAELSQHSFAHADNVSDEQKKNETMNCDIVHTSTDFVLWRDKPSRPPNQVHKGHSIQSEINSRYTSVCVTNEHNTSQSYVFCFSKTSHVPHSPINGNYVIQTIDGTSMCYNLERISVHHGHSHKGRDTVSILVIGLTGLANLILETTFSPSHPNISHSNTDS
ncbi:hypothetical protein INT47_005260, partial [Mucor saturninus]